MVLKDESDAPLLYALKLKHNLDMYTHSEAIQKFDIQFSRLKSITNNWRSYLSYTTAREKNTGTYCIIKAIHCKESRNFYFYKAFRFGSEDCSDVVESILEMCDAIDSLG